MPFTLDLPAAARRHLEAANTLDQTKRRDVAGYLYGIAAECAIKALMQQAGFKASKSGEKDPYYLHFPELKKSLRDKLEGRKSALLKRHITTPLFFDGWDIKMRYSKGSQVPTKTLNLWKSQATDAVSSIGS